MLNVKQNKIALFVPLREKVGQIPHKDSRRDEYSLKNMSFAEFLRLGKGPKRKGATRQWLIRSIDNQPFEFYNYFAGIMRPSMMSQFQPADFISFPPLVESRAREESNSELTTHTVWIADNGIIANMQLRPVLQFRGSSRWKETLASCL